MSHDTKELREKLRTYFWPRPYPQQVPPTRVTFSNGLPESDGDGTGMVFDVPYALFEKAIGALIAQHDTELLEEIKGNLPARREPTESIDEDWAKDNVVYSTLMCLGFNEALDGVTAAIDQFPDNRNMVNEKGKS